jgi:sugar phosphate isomerase/epimerase
MHFKDNPNYLGEGKIDVPAVLRAVSRIGYEGFGNLETSNPSKSVEIDMKRNLAYIRKVISDIERS